MVPEPKQRKLYILDTNVLLHDPRAIESFEGVLIGIPSVVLEELDSFKREATDRGRNAREVIRHLDQLRQEGSLGKGVKLTHGSTLKVLFLPLAKAGDAPFDLHKSDNAIILTAYILKQEGYQVKLISKDLNVRVKADALGIDTEDYLKEFVTQEEFYKGWVRLQVPSIQLKGEIPASLKELEHSLVPNEYVLVESKNNPFNYKVFRYVGHQKFIPVYQPHMRWPLQARNPQQLMALDLLMDDSIKFICLLGPAGTGKTFLAMLAGLHKVLVEDTYEKMLISRPVVPLGRDIGYLPGDVREKLHSWMLPIYDNMEFILHSAHLISQEQEVEEEHRGGKLSKHRKHLRKKQRSDLVSLDELLRRGKLNMEAITYMRGRSIPYQFILIDETQNLTPHEVKTIVSRVGEGSKIVLAGDPYQIDSPYLDFSSNGLVVASERFKGNRIFGSIFLETSERSELSKLAAELL